MKKNRARVSFFLPLCVFSQVSPCASFSTSFCTSSSSSSLSVTPGFRVRTLDLQSVHPLALADAVVYLALVHAVVRLVEHLEHQEGAIHLGQRGQLSVFPLPDVGPGTAERHTQKKRGTTTLLN